jgi:hypothetical protein
MNNCFCCGKETENPKFCSHSCSAKIGNIGNRKHGSPPKECLICGGETRNKKYCSNDCSIESMRMAKRKYIEDTQNICGKIGESGMKTFLLEKHGKKCMVCNGTEWFGKPMPLELHHLNGKSKDNSIENLMIICPNCHTFTDTYKSKNENSDREYFKINQRR